MVTPELRAKVIRLLRAHLGEFPPGRTASSGEILAHLANVIPPEDFQDIGKSRLLMDLAKRDLSVYATRGQPVANRFGGTKTPWIWHAPQEAPPLPSPAQPAEELLTYSDFREKTDSVTAHFNAMFAELHAKLDEILQRLEIFK